MDVIDTHCHASPWWLEPVETVLFQMDRNGVDKTVLVQVRGDFDNAYLLECARAHPGSFSVMGVVDTTQPDAADALTRWHDAGVGSVRLAMPGRPADGDTTTVWRRAAELRMPVSTDSNALEVTADTAKRLIEELPALPIIVEHDGFLRLPEADREQGFRELLKLARYPNVYMKVHGFGGVLPKPTPPRDPPFDLADVPDHIDRAIDAFGASRLMLATGFPLSSSREGYANIVRLVSEYLGRWSAGEREAVLGGTAASLFNFGPVNP